jgi:hypothetical protein
LPVGIFQQKAEHGNVTDITTIKSLGKFPSWHEAGSGDPCRSHPQSIWVTAVRQRTLPQSEGYTHTPWLNDMELSSNLCSFASLPLSVTSSKSLSRDNDTCPFSTQTLHSTNRNGALLVPGTALLAHVASLLLWKLTRPEWSSLLMSSIAN